MVEKSRCFRLRRWLRSTWQGDASQHMLGYRIANKIVNAYVMHGCSFSPAKTLRYFNYSNYFSITMFSWWVLLLVAREDDEILRLPLVAQNDNPVISRERKRTEKSKRFFDAFHLLRMTILSFRAWLRNLIDPSTTLRVTMNIALLRVTEMFRLRRWLRSTRQSGVSFRESVWKLRNLFVISRER